MTDEMTASMTRDTTASSEEPWPEQVAFEKYQGTKNDFLIVDERKSGVKLPSLPQALRIAMCDRHTGVGADGVLTLLAPKTTDAVAAMHVTNSDGSEPGMCGNGLRCVSQWLADSGAIPRGAKHVIDTPAGLHSVTHKSGMVVVRMRGARLDGVVTDGQLVRQPITAGGETFVGTAISVGNPHLVLEAPAVRTLARRYGADLSTDPRFPDGANIGFAKARGKKELDLIVWERGAGLTMACGTGATAAVAAFVHAGTFPPDEEIIVHLPGGDLAITVSADLATIVMRGPARRVFAGTVKTADLQGYPRDRRSGQLVG